MRPGYPDNLPPAGLGASRACVGAPLEHSPPVDVDRLTPQGHGRRSGWKVLHTRARPMIAAAVTAALRRLSIASPHHIPRTPDLFMGTGRRLCCVCRRRRQTSATTPRFLSLSAQRPSAPAYAQYSLSADSACLADPGTRLPWIPFCFGAAGRWTCIRVHSSVHGTSNSIRLHRLPLSDLPASVLSWQPVRGCGTSVFAVISPPRHTPEQLQVSAPVFSRRGRRATVGAGHDSCSICGPHSDC
ncbi:hypothetical protein OH76DRAFT_686103 [Lentinus brumalis]|uniref:Uncharacterized protein n=1 Tax=Lentinus brumalis TaxID=2498619 RepID=A0A371D6W5_9APHY|nr:hypothetical protein OH76DRAFT_686103 [Polyporus brumalis]